MIITRRYEIDMGHCLAEHKGKCYRPHGHRYVIEATAEGQVQHGIGAEQGMVVDFATLRDTLADVLDDYDHRFVMSVDDKRAGEARDLFGEGVALITQAPTAENLAKLWGECIRDLLVGDVDLVNLRVYETPNCWADWQP